MAPLGGFCRADLRLLHRLPHGSGTVLPDRPLCAPCMRAERDQPASAQAHGGCSGDLLLCALDVAVPSRKANLRSSACLLPCSLCFCHGQVLSFGP